MLSKTERNINDYTNITDMAIVNTTVRQWGRSLGVVIPRPAITEEHIEVGDTIQVIIMKKSKTFAELFGAAKIPKQVSTEKLLKETDKEAWDE